MALLDVSRVELEDRGWVFFHYGSDIFRATSDAVIDHRGIPVGARWFCPRWQWPRLQEGGCYPFEQQRLAI